MRSTTQELGDTRRVSEGPELAQPGPQLNGAAVRHRDFSQQPPEFQKPEDEGDGNELSNSEPLAGSRIRLELPKACKRSRPLFALLSK